jgi:hypothetical protein
MFMLWIQPFLLVVIAGLIAWMLYGQERNAARVDVRAEETKTALKETKVETFKRLEDIAIVADKTHVLVNSKYGDALRLTATTARALAKYSGKPEDRIAADMAEAMLKEHEEKQTAVDNKAAMGGTQQVRASQG